MEMVAVGAQHLHEFGQQPEGGFQRPQIGDLAADMHVDAGDLDARQLCRAGIDRAGAGQRDAELVLGLAGRDLGVRPGIDVGIDPNRDPRRPAGLAGEPRQQFELRLGFDVDAEDVFGQRGAQLGFGLADAREQDLVRRNAGGQRPLNSPPDTRRLRSLPGSSTDCWNSPSRRSRPGRSAKASAKIR
jgi:hypothetical protein